MELMEAIKSLERWRPITEWDDHIKELPKSLTTAWQMILEARKSESVKTMVSQKDIKDMVEAIQDDVPPSTVFKWYKLNYTRKNAEILGINDVVEEYYQRTGSFYVVDTETNEINKFANRSKLAGYFNRNQTTISNYINKNKNVWGTKKRIYSYTNFKQRKEFKE